MSHGHTQALAKEIITSGDGARPRPLYYGWVMLPLSMAALIASSPGQTFGVSIFNEPMRLSLGLTHGQLAFAYALGTIAGAVPITWIGSIMDRRGLRVTMLAVITLFSGACLVTSFAQGLFTLVLAFALLRMLGPGALSFLSGNTLPFWFERRLGTVEGIRQLGMATAMAVVPVLNLWLLTSFGWRLSYALLGGAIWCLLFPLFLLLLRNRPEDVGQAFDGRRDVVAIHQRDHAASEQLSWGFTLSDALRTWAFWAVTAGTAMYSLIHTAVFFCLVPILQERGLTGQHAATMLTIFAACLAVTQMLGGFLADRIRSQALLFLGMSGLGGSMLLLQLATTPIAAYVSGAALGASQGLFFGAAHPLWARYFGRRHLGRIRGVLMTIQIGASSFGPLMAGLARDYLGSFWWVLAVFAVMPLPVAALSLMAAPPRRELAESHEPQLSTVHCA